MAEFLTFLENKSSDFLWQRRNRIEYPDENYAREIMQASQLTLDLFHSRHHVLISLFHVQIMFQLFTIGLTKLNNNGTPVTDENGTPLLTYTIDEIVEYAKVWTVCTITVSCAV